MLPVIVGILIGLCLVTLLVAAYACHLAIQSQIDVKALQNSTHQVQLVPVDSDDVEMDEEQSAKAMAKADQLAMESLTLDGDQPLS